jgi:nucleotide-binding universal stress UspA family protein
VKEGSGPVLLAYDGSPSSATAIAVAGRLLPGRHALVCHAWTGLSRTMLHSDPEALPGVLRDAAVQLDEADLAEANKTAAEGVLLAQAAGFDADPLPVRAGRKTWRRLLQAAENHQASLIVAGAHGISGIGRAILGSVSTGLVHHSHVPVLVVPATSREEETDGPVMLCYDGSETSKPLGSSLAAACGGQRQRDGHRRDPEPAGAPSHETTVRLARESCQLARRTARPRGA